MPSTALPFALLHSILLSAPTHDAATVSGRVVDAAGRAVPRAIVRAVDASGRTATEVLARADGTFAFEVPTGDCRIEASLAGFTPAVAPCGTAVQLTLGIAPLVESVVVSANRSETPAAQVASSLTVFTADDIERRQTPPVADLLATAPGVMVSRSGGYGNVTSVFVRGGESNYNKVLLDGIPLNEPGGVFNFSNVTAENLDRIEIVRGAHSALFGSDAMTSVIQLFTRRPQPGEGQRFVGSIEGGTYDTGRANAGVRGAHGGFDYSLGAAHLVTDNREPNNHFRNDTVSASLGYQVSERTRIRGVVRGEFGRAGTPGQAAFGRPDLDAFFDRKDTVAGMTVFQELSTAVRHRATYGLHATRQRSVNLEIDPPFTPVFGDRTAPFEFFDFRFHSRTRLQRHYATYQADVTLVGQSASAGVHQVTSAIDWEGERGTLTDVLAAESTEVARDNFGLTLQHQASWPRIFATAGVRIERNDSFGTSAAPRGSLALIARRGTGRFGDTTVKGSAGRGIKEPTALQTFSRSPFFLGNPDLDPETSRALELGVEQRAAGGRARVEATWFDNHYENIIATRTISFSPFVSQYFNVGTTEARGLELSAAVAASGGIQARGGYTWLDSEVVESRTPDDPVFGVGRWLFRRPRHSGFFDVVGRRGPLFVGATAVFVGRRVDSDFAVLDPAITENDGHSRWDVRSGYRISRQLMLTLAIDNLTDAGYMEPLGYRALGRAIRAGVRAEF